MSSGTQSKSFLLATAGAVVLAIVTVEYLARHVVAPALPVLAAPQVNDMAVTAVAYLALSLVVARSLGAGGPIAAVRGVVRSASRWEGWVGGGVAFVSVGFALADRALWGGVALPSFHVPANQTTVAAGLTWLAPASLLAVNGLVVPLAEEWLWRGVVQPRLVGALGALLGVAVTAVLFSAKHAIVDASLGRMLTIFAVGLVLGWVAFRVTWKASAVSHVLMNTVATVLAIVVQYVAPTCLSPQPTLSPELRDAVDRAVALLDSHDPHEIESLFTPSYLEKFSTHDSVAFLERVHGGTGHCSWRCAVETDGPHRATSLLSCDKMNARMTVGVETSPPHRVNYFVVVSSPF